MDGGEDTGHDDDVEMDDEDVESQAENQYDEEGLAIIKDKITIVSESGLRLVASRLSVIH